MIGGMAALLAFAIYNKTRRRRRGPTGEAD